MEYNADFPIYYQSNFIDNPDIVFHNLIHGLDWVRRDSTPRYEYYVNKYNLPYTYGRDKFARTYESQANHPVISHIQYKLYEMLQIPFEVCFLNRYKDQSDSLGWHADDSPEMDDARPIAIVSLGVEREIWFCKQNDKQNKMVLKLQHGSLCVMAPGMQDTHFHRIPKASFQCGERISLTFRGLVI
jgi:alkylated DNA repair dioxygenase AlkB